MPTHRKKSSGEGPTNVQDQVGRRNVISLYGDQQTIDANITPAQEVAKRVLLAQLERSGVQQVQRKIKQDTPITDSIFRWCINHWKLTGCVIAATILLPPLVGVNTPAVISSISKITLDLFASTGIIKTLAGFPWYGSALIGAGYLALRCAIHVIKSKSLTLEYLNNRVTGTALLTGILHGLATVPFSLGSVGLWAGIGVAGGFISSELFYGIRFDLSEKRRRKMDAMKGIKEGETKEELRGSLQQSRDLGRQLTNLKIQKKVVSGKLDSATNELEQASAPERIAYLREEINILRENLESIEHDIPLTSQELYESHISFFNQESYPQIVNTTSHSDNIHEIRAAIEEVLKQTEAYPVKIIFTLELAFLSLKAGSQRGTHELQHAMEFLGEYRSSLTIAQRIASSRGEEDRVQEIDDIFKSGTYRELEILFEVFRACPQSAVSLYYHSHSIKDAVRETSEKEAGEDSQEIVSEEQLADSVDEGSYSQAQERAMPSEEKLVDAIFDTSSSGTKYFSKIEIKRANTQGDLDVYAPREEIRVSLMSRERDTKLRVVLDAGAEGQWYYDVEDRAYYRINKPVVVVDNDSTLRFPIELPSESGRYILKLQVPEWFGLTYTDIAKVRVIVHDPSDQESA